MRNSLHGYRMRARTAACGDHYQLYQVPNNAHSPGLSASMAKKQVEWYQGGDFVTVSLKLRPVIPPQTRGEIKAEFHEQHCAIYEGGKHTF